MAIGPGKSTPVAPSPSDRMCTLACPADNPSNHPGHGNTHSARRGHHKSCTWLQWGRDASAECDSCSEAHARHDPEAQQVAIPKTWCDGCKPTVLAQGVVREAAGAITAGLHAVGGVSMGEYKRLASKKVQSSHRAQPCSDQRADQRMHGDMTSCHFHLYSFFPHLARQATWAACACMAVVHGSI